MGWFNCSLGGGCINWSGEGKIMGWVEARERGGNRLDGSNYGMGNGMGINRDKKGMI